MKNKTIVLSLVGVLMLSFGAAYTMSYAVISFLEPISGIVEESAALVEVQQDSFQKNMLIQALAEKVGDKDTTIQILTKAIEDKQGY